jgi:Rrf2 family protein
MKISRSTSYAILAVGYVAKNQDEGIVLSQTISKKYNIPLEYLLKILQQLVRANILNSKRGPRGGFSLAKTPSKINLLQIVEAVEGPMEPEMKLGTKAKRDKFCSKANKAYAKAISQAKSVLEKTKVSALLRA